MTHIFPNITAVIYEELFSNKCCEKITLEHIMMIWQNIFKANCWTLLTVCPFQWKVLHSPGAHGAGAPFAAAAVPVSGVAGALGGGAYAAGDAQRAAQHGQAAG